MTEIKEWQQFTPADIRDANLSNCSKCFKLIDYAYITTGEVMCEACWCKLMDEESVKKELKE